MSKYSIVNEIPEVGNVIELTIQHRGRDHLGKKYNWIHEISKVIGITKNKSGRVTEIQITSKMIPCIRVSRKLLFYTTLFCYDREFRVTIEIIPKEKRRRKKT